MSSQCLQGNEMLNSKGFIHQFKFVTIQCNGPIYHHLEWAVSFTPLSSMQLYTEEIIESKSSTIGQQQQMTR